ncbi:MAG: hypothetical protein ISR65_13460 [Bacteriovoracaceae bacterium]|nr:hypothetical protein [Bacteriovoracaceae bacterium]
MGLVITNAFGGFSSVVNEYLVNPDKMMPTLIIGSASIILGFAVMLYRSKISINKRKLEIKKQWGGNNLL